MSINHNLSSKYINSYNYDISALEEDELQTNNYPAPVKYERYDKKAFLNAKKLDTPNTVSQKSLNSKSKLDSKSCNRITNLLNINKSKPNAAITKYKVDSRRNKSKNMNLSVNAYHDYKHTSVVPKTMVHAKKSLFGKHKESACSSNGSNLRRKRDDRRPLNFRSIDRFSNISSENTTVRNITAKAIPKVSKTTKTTFTKAEKMKKKSIADVCKNDPRKYRIIAFAQEVAAKKIQRYFRIHAIEIVERLQIRIERIRVNYATAVIRKYASIYLKKRIAFKQTIAYHAKYNVKSILFIQRNFRKMRSNLKPIDTLRFKQVLYAVLLGWKVRRIIDYLKSLPEMREAVDFI
jgi:hypothetical protein